ncbi:VOC family protein [Adhaeribacter sp. BT258]|uniref:VOC family protein n=1 Tax=Adhaeribacter terrigena TaxID=2793070 RepID=A0ABS1C2H2_9BACT|nr:VOC family protein [Adhaeribacter terrigena]MBK0403530.1 VOC family protein [Adhaeribacter terrigena]
MKRVIGIGGVFFKSQDPAALRAWYQKHLGIDSETWGATFNWNAPETKAQHKEFSTAWNPFPENTTYYAPSQKPFMINYIVADLAALVQALKTEGVELVGEMVEEEYGKFAWIMDPEGNKIELWEPA